MDTEKVDMIKMKQLEAKSLASKVYNELGRDDLDVDDFITLLGVCPPSKKIDQEYATLLTYRYEGRDLKDPKDSAEKLRLTALIYTGFKEFMFNLDALSLIAGMNFDTDQRFINYNIFNQDAFTYKVEDGGKFILISGNLGTGKTHLASLLGDNSINSKKLHVLTNINFLEELQMIKKIYCTSDLLIEGLKLYLQGKRWVAILDESGVWQHKQDHATRKNIEWDKLYRLIRKFGGSMIFIDQKRTGFTGTLKEFATVHLHKYKKSSMKVDIIDPSLKAHHYIRGIPDTPLKFDTNDIAFFVHDIELKDVLEQATAIKGSKKQMQSIVKYLEDQKDKKLINGIEPRQVAIFLREKSIQRGEKLTYAEISDLIDANPNTVAGWCQNKDRI